MANAARAAGPDGMLIAIDSQPRMVETAARKAEAAGLTNVTSAAATAGHLPLKDSSIDRAFLIAVLPEIPDRRQALAELRRVLRPEGVLSISEEFLDPHYPRLARTLCWVEEAGFEVVERSGSWWAYTLNFRPRQI